MLLSCLVPICAFLASLSSGAQPSHAVENAEGASSHAANEDALLLQVLDLQLATGDLQGAVATSERLLRRWPDDVGLAHRHARLLEWVGRPEEALSHWARLERRAPALARDPPAWQLALDVARFDVAQSLLLERAMATPLQAQELTALAYSTWQGGDVDTVIRALRELLRDARGHRPYWGALVGLLDDVGRMDEVAAVYAAMERRFELTPEERLGWGEALVVGGRLEEALAVLLAADPPAAAAAGDYWTLRADLAWQLDRPREVLEAYRRVAATVDLRRLDLDRYIVVAQWAGQHELAEGLAVQGFVELGDADHLVSALFAAIERGDGEAAAKLVGMGEQAGVDHSDFWLLAAQHYQGHDAWDAAERALRRGLERDPDDDGTRAAYLWFLMNTDSTERLATVVSEWSGDEIESAAAAALAVAYVRLDRPLEALTWFEREYSRHVDDHGWLLTYADALERVGRVDAGWRLRRYVVDRLAPTWSPETGPALASATRRFRGNGASRSLIDAVDSAEVGESWYMALVDQHLAEGDAAAARAALGVAAARGFTLPGWQRLAVALGADDLRTVESLLEDPAALTPADRAIALDRVGRGGEARRTVRAAAARDPHTAAALRPLAVSLFDHRPTGFEATVAGRTFGDVRLTGPRLLVRRAWNRWDTVLVAGHHRLQDGAGVDEDAIGDEVELKLEAVRHRRRSSALFAASLAERPDDRLDGLRTALEWRWRNGLSATGSVVYAQVPELSGPLRLLGQRHGLQLEVGGVPARRRFWHLSAGWDRYESRTDGIRLGSGPRLYGVIGERILAGPLAWAIRLEGVWQSLEHAAELPPDVTSRLRRPLQMDAFLPEAYRAVWIGSRWHRGEPGTLSRHAGSPRLSLDLTAGYTYPSNEPLFGVSVAVGWRAFGPDELAINLALSREAGVLTEDSTSRVGLTYSYRFE